MPVDPLSMSVTLVKEIWIGVQRVKVYQRRCKNLASRCDILVNALTENTTEIGPPTADAVHEAKEVLLSVQSRVMRWADLNMVQSILAQGDISQGVDDMHQRIDTCIAVYNVRIGRELVLSHIEQALAAERDRAELRENIQGLREALSQYIRGNRVHTPYGVSSHAAAEEALSTIREEINDTQSSTFDEGGFEYAIERFSRSLATLELHLPDDAVSLAAFGNPTSHAASASRTSLESCGSSASPPSRVFGLPIDLPGLPRNRQSSMPLGCPRLPPLNLDGQEAVSLPGQTFSEEPSSPLSVHSSVFSKSSFTTVHPAPSILSDVSRISSSLEVALNTRVSMWLSTDNSCIPTKATMEGMVRYFLLNPVDAEKHDTFFMGHIAYISSHSLLGILIRQFNEASTFADIKRDNIRISVMRLVKNWLINRHVIIANDVLGEIQGFVDAINGSGELRNLALEVLRLLPDKESQNSSISPIIPSFKPGKNPSTGQLAAALTTISRRLYLRILATEYIAHASNLPSYCPNLEEALSWNKRIANWVISSILQSDVLKKRSNDKRYFLSTAKECRNLRDFSSANAIMGALQSPLIECLVATHNAMPPKARQLFQKLAKLFAQESNYGAYKAAVQSNAKQGCIPWHDKHIHDINTVLREEEDVEDHHEPPLINFEKWTHLKDRALDALRYRDIPLKYSEDGLEAATGYLKQQLQGVTVGDDSSQIQQTKSARLEKAEAPRPTRSKTADVMRQTGFGGVR